MKIINIAIFGANGCEPSDGCSCGPASRFSCSGPADLTKKEAEHLKKSLVKKFGDVIKFDYVDVQSEEMKNYPEIKEILYMFRLPLTVVEGQPLFQGGFSIKMVSDTISEILNS